MPFVPDLYCKQHIYLIFTSWNHNCAQEWKLKELRNNLQFNVLVKLDCVYISRCNVTDFIIFKILAWPCWYYFFGLFIIKCYSLNSSISLKNLVLRHSVFTLVELSLCRAVEFKHSLSLYYATMAHETLSVSTLRSLYLASHRICEI